MGQGHTKATLSNDQLIELAKKTKITPLKIEQWFKMFIVDNPRKN